jgi:hypothetical protein
MKQSSDTILGNVTHQLPSMMVGEGSVATQAALFQSLTYKRAPALKPKLNVLGWPGVAYEKIAREGFPIGRIHALTVMLLAGKPRKGYTARAKWAHHTTVTLNGAGSFVARTCGGAWASRPYLPGRCRSRSGSTTHCSLRGWVTVAAMV